MKQTLTIIVASLAAVVLFGALVYAVLVAAHLSGQAVTTVHGMTLRRLWATVSVGLALVGLVIGALALARPTIRVGRAPGRLGAIVAQVAGVIATLNGALNLAFATGGPGTGNGVVGAAAAIVLGVFALALGGLAQTRDRRAKFKHGRMT